MVKPEVVANNVLDDILKRPPAAVTDGITDFVAEPFYYGEIPQEGMRKFIVEAEKTSVAAACERVLVGEFEKGPWLREYIQDDSRADWRFILEPDPEGTVLDLGCGYGGISIPLAEMFGAVVAADPTWERVKTLALRARDLGIENIVPVRADALDLPFREGSLDGVVMMGVLEWVGMARTGSVRELQLQALEGIRKALKPGGFLALGIENRFGYNYFLGEEDEHSHLKFATLLPRFLADGASRVLKRKPYRTYTYSYHGYQKLLRAAGFSSAHFWGAIPKYRYPDFVIDLSKPAPLTYYINAVGKKRGLKRYGFSVVRVLNRLGVWKKLFPTFIIVARK